MINQRKTRMVMRTLPILLLTAVGEGRAQTPQAAKQAPPAPRAIPGVTAPDQFARGCVDCHINRPDAPGDTRLSTVMKRWYTKVDTSIVAKVKGAAPKTLTLKGKHPLAQGALRDIPTGCLTCHRTGSTIAPSLEQMAHLIHLTSGPGARFLTEFQGECSHCHKLNAATGKWSMPSGPEK